MARWTLDDSGYLSRPDAVRQQLGSFWEGVFARPDQIRSMVDARLELAAQTHQHVEELADAFSRFSAPVLQRRRWVRLRLRESDRNSDEASLLRYDGSAGYHPATPYQYGVPFTGARPTWAAPPNLRSLPLLANRMTSPSATLVEGVDYALERGAIRFREDPFRNSAIPKQEIRDVQGEVVDRQISLWGWQAGFDEQALYKQYGYVFGLQLESSRRYRDLLNALYDMLIEGTTVRSLGRLFEALLDAPLARGGETVERIVREPSRTWVITDREAYRASANAQIPVSEGDTLSEGDALTGALSFFDLQRGGCPDPDRLARLALGPGLLAAGFYQDLVFPNESVPLETFRDDEGDLGVRWELQGFPGDVDRFFDLLHARGKASGQTMANLLDTRADPATETQPEHLPDTINPMEFLCRNVFRHQALLAFVDPTQQGPEALGLGYGRVLRQVLPPQFLLIVAATLAIEDQPLTMGESGSAEHPGAEEHVAASLDKSTREGLTAGLIGERVRIRQIGGTCQPAVGSGQVTQVERVTLAGDLRVTPDGTIRIVP